MQSFFSEENILTLDKVIIRAASKENQESMGMYFIENDGSELFESYKELYENSKNILGALQNQGFQQGSQLIFQINNKAFINMFWACMLGGIVAVPLPVPLITSSNTEAFHKILKVTKQLPNASIISDRANLSSFKECYEENQINYIEYEMLCVKTETETLNFPSISYNDIAYIQYSSGSTGNPKGVKLTHENIVFHLKQIADRLRLVKKDMSASWLPLTHDMGLIGYHLTPVLSVNNQIQMNSKTFLTQPSLYLQKISQLKATIAVSPNFGLEWMANVVKESQLEHLDLSQLRMIMCGAEPISMKTIRRFYDRYTHYGLKENSIFQVYGMAEACLAITIPLEGNNRSVFVNRHKCLTGKPVEYVKESSLDATEFAMLGQPLTGVEVIIADDEDNIMPENYIGNILVKGKNIFHGYMNQDTQLFNKDGFFNTGDLGFICDGELVVTGRAKDILFVNGQNYYYSDIESMLVTQLPQISQVVVSAYWDQNATKDRIAIFVYDDGEDKLFAELAQQINNIVLERIGIGADYVIPVKTIPKTASGKVQRYRLIELLENHVFDDVMAIAPHNYQLVTEPMDQEVKIKEIEDQLLEIAKDIFSIETINIDDPISRMGFNSLTLIRFQNELSQKFQIEISIVNLLKLSTLRELSRMIGSQSKTEEKSMQNLTGDSDLWYEPFPVTKIQEAYLIGRQNSIEMGNVSAHAYYEIETGLDIQRLTAALNQVIKHQLMLRTIFDETGMQKVLRRVPYYDIDTKDLRGLSDEEQHQQILEMRKLRSHFVYQQDHWPLFEFSAFILGENRNYLFADIDLLIADGGSLLILMQEIMNYYENPDVKIKPLTFQFSDYANALQKFRNHLSYQRDQDFWMKKIDDFASAPSLPMCCRTELIEKPTFKRRERRLSQEQWNLIKQLASKHNVTTSVFLCTIYAEILSKWSNQSRIALNLTLFNRQSFHQDVMRLIGDFTSVLLLDIDLTLQNSFWERAAMVKNNLFEAVDHRFYSGVNFIRNLASKRKLSSKAIMPIVFTSMLFDQSEFSNNMDKWGKMQYGISQTPQVFLDFQVMERDGELLMTWDYVEELFDEEIINSMFETYQLRLQQILNNNLSSIAIPQKQEKLLAAYNNTKEEYQIDLLHKLIDQQCQKTPNAISVKLGNQTLSYHELATKSNQIAHYLKEFNYNHGSYIGVWAERRIETIINIVAILKAGYAYIPVNPEHPKERIEYILQHSGAKMIVYPDLYEKDNLSTYSQEALNNDESSLNDKAYVIYTSGSTGRPKGVVITHEAVVNTLIDINRKFNVNSEDKIIGLSSMCFDLSVYDIFGALISGAQLVMIPDLLDMDNIYQVVVKEKITVWNSVPAIMGMYIENSARQVMGEASSECLRIIMMSGDWIPLTLPEKINMRMPQAQIISLGGATEGSIWSIYYPVKEISPEWKSIPYGYPLANQHIFVLDEFQEECPVGVLGELYIGGRGVAFGYLNDEEKTKAAFIDHKFGRLYKTGDYGIMHPEGYVEFLGRRDSQVKIRGHRIELGEIEHCLNRISGIQQSVVTEYIDQQGEKHLCGYIVADEMLNHVSIQEQLKDQLPDYMIPAQLMCIDEIPLSSNGKVDRNLLPKPGVSENDSSKADAYEPPKSQEEKLVVAAFEDVLGLEEVGVNDNLFDLGGDSIKAIHILNKIREAGYDSSMRNLLMERTPKQIAKNLSIKKETINAEQEEISGEILLTPIQSYFFAQNMVCPQHFNVNQMFEARERVNVLALQQVLSTLVQYHDMLRATCKDGQQIIGKFDEKKWYGFTEIECELDEIKEKIKQIHIDMNLETGPLLHAVLCHIKDKDYLLLSAHHMVMDVISWRILTNDLERCYRNIMNNETIQLPAKTVSYRAWSEGLKRYSVSKKFEKAESYWGKIDEKLKNGKFLGDKEEKGYQPKVVTVCLNAETTEKLLKKSAQAYHTEINDLLLTALGRAVHNVTGQTALTVQMEGHGREEAFGKYDLGRTIGWFTSIYPVVLEELGSSVQEDIRNTKESLRRVPCHGFDYGILKQKKCDMNIDADISFNYLSEFIQDSESSYFMFSNLLYGQDSDPHNQFGPSINIVGLVKEGTLTMSVTCNNSQYSRERIELLGKEYERELIAIANHCANAQISEYTASDFGENDWTDNEFRHVQDKIRSQGGEIECIYPLTPMQEGMLYEKLMEETSTRYVVQQTMRLSNVDVERMHHAFQMLADKHEVLRSKICYHGVSKPRQVLLKARTLEFHYVEVEDEQAYRQLKLQDVKRGFDLEKDSLIRMNIIKIKDGEYRLMMTNYHIILDGWCLPILREDLFNFYRTSDMRNAKESMESDNNISHFRDFVDYLQDKENETGYEYWENLLDGYEVQANILPMGRDQVVDEESQSQEFYLSTEITKQAEAICVKYGSTLNTFVEACWSLLLQKYNLTNDVVFGKVVSGRNAQIKGIENIVGLFINTIPVRAVTEDDQSFIDLLNLLQSQAVAANDYDVCSLAEIQNHSTLGRDLIGTLFFYEGYQAQDMNLDDKIEVQFEAYREQISYNLGLTAFRSDSLHFRLLYNTALYGKEEITIIGEHLKNLMECVIKNPETNLQEVTLINETEKEIELKQLNDTYAEYLREKTIIQLFEEQVARTPDKIAVVYGEEELTYLQLNSRANSLALKLRLNYNIQPDDFIAIIAERSLEMVIGLYAILKSGAAYVPIDPSYPKERIDFILKDCQPKAILVGGSNIQISNDNVVDLYSECKDIQEVENLEHVNTPQSLVYLVYTSGTTGKPKGVMVENQNIVNQELWTQREYPLLEGDSILMKTTCVFDVFAWEVFWWMLEGGKVVILPQGEETESDKIIKIINRHSIKAIQFVPSMFHMFLDELERSKEQIPTVKYIISIGERLNEESVRQYNILKDKGQACAQLLNLYGPAETTVNSTGFICPSSLDINKVLIGKPISNTQIYILNGHRLTGIGMPGELCIAGESVSRGYLNRKELTAEKFEDNPYGAGKMYRTGDLARWMPDGNLEYLDRMDDQVKIRGVRIELGEIESILLNLDNVSAAAVAVKEDNTGEQCLCAYIVNRMTEENNNEFNEDEIRCKLHEKLPEYMVPTYIMKIDKIPLSHNGKINRSALMRPVYQSKQYVAPANKEEMIVAETVEKVLGIDKVSILDDFVELGGHSLKATLLSNELEKVTGTRIPLRDIFELNSLRKIAEKLQNLQNNQFSEIPKVKEEQFYPMSSAQRRLYLLNEMSEPNITYNISNVMRYDITLDPQRLQMALDQLLEREEILRTSFHIVDSELVQRIENNVKVILEVKKADTMDLQSEYDEFIRPFDLSKAPLLRIKLLQTTKGSYLMLDIHHIISDGESLPIMIHELNELYECHNLFMPRVSYKDYCAWNRSQDVEAQANYWKNEFNSEIPVLDLMTDYSRPLKKSFMGSSVQVKIEEQVMEQVNKMAKKHGATEFMVMLSTFMLLLNKYSQQEDIIIGTPVSGRTHVDTQSMLGMFVNTLAIKGKIISDETFEQLMIRIKDKCLMAYDNQEYQYEDLVDEVVKGSDRSRNPLFDVMFLMSDSRINSNVSGDLSGTWISMDIKVAKFDLNLMIIHTLEGYIVNLEYATDLFQETSMMDMAENYVALLNEAVMHPEKSLDGFTLISALNTGVIGELAAASLESEPENDNLAQEFSNLLQAIQKRNDTYWARKAEEFTSAIQLPMICEPQQIEAKTYECLESIMDEDNWNILKTKAEERKITPSALLCTVYAEVLYRWTSQTKMALKLTVSNHQMFYQDSMNMFGNSISELPIEIDLSSHTDYWQKTAMIQKTLFEALDHRFYNKDDFISILAKNQHVDIKDAMPVSFTCISLDDTGYLNVNKNKAFPALLELKAVNKDGKLQLSWEYVKELFDESIMSSMFETLKLRLQQVMKDQLISMPLPKEQAMMWAEYNNTKADYEGDLLHRVIDIQCQSTPSAIAVKLGDHTLSYGELAKKSNQIAHYLKERNVKHGSYIGIWTERKIETIINILAVLKAGCAYVPVNPEHPKERIDYIVKHSDIEIMLYPDLYEKEQLASYSDEMVEDIECIPQDKAYVIYTSGSTGNPKGVIITHQAVLNTLQDINEKFQVNSTDKIIALSSMCFDLSVYDIFGAFISGAELVMIPDLLDMDQIHQIMVDEIITIWNSVPAIMDMYMESIAQMIELHSDLDNMRLVMMSGDWISLSLPDKIKSKMPNAKIISLGGATEGSIWSIHFPINEIKSEWKSIPYGYPLRNQQIYVLDEFKEVCPIGIAGELYIGGLGVASGYLNDDEKTKAAFIHDTLGYLYKTGDYGVMCKEGYIEFLGRRDGQIKIRGHRIELGEIEYCLNNLPDIRQSVVSVYLDHQGEKQMCAYIVSDKTLELIKIQQEVSRHLPDYMVPDQFMQLDTIPLSANCKVDRKQLPEPQLGSRTKKYEAPKTKTESQIIEAYTKVLGLDDIGAYDSFFELGGSSLKVIQLCNEIEKSTGIRVPLKDIFVLETPRKIAGQIKNLNASGFTEITEIEEAEYYTVSSAQKRLYLLSQLTGPTTTYNIPAAIKLSYKPDRERLTQALIQLVEQEEILRTSFHMVDGQPVQKVEGNSNISLKYRKMDNMDYGEIQKEYNNFVCPFDLSSAPLMRLELLETESDSYLFIDIHHIICDAGSIPVILYKIQQLYEGKKLTSPRVQYKDFCAWQVKRDISKQADYWKNEFSKDIPILNLLTDFPRPQTQSFKGANIRTREEGKTRDSVQALAKKYGATEFMVLLSIDMLFLAKYSLQEEIIVGTPISGRTHADTQDMIGMFVNTLAIKGEVHKDMTFEQLLSAVKEKCLQAYDNQEYQFEELVEAVETKRDFSRNPIFDVMFVLQDNESEIYVDDINVGSWALMENNISKLDLTLNITNDTKGYLIDFEYCTDLFKTETVQTMEEHFVRLLHEVIEHPEKRLDDISMINSKEEEKLLIEFNETDADYPKQKTVVELFEEQVMKTPDNIAVEFEEQQLTYAQLNARANSLARLLRQEYDIKPNDFVVILTERCLEMIVGIYAILKAGAAYVPVDPSYPEERIKFIINDCKPKVILCGSSAPDIDLPIISIKEEANYKMECDELTPVNKPNDLMYVIYTSGTTGWPKGVLIEHVNVVRLLKNDKFRFDFRETDIWTQFHSYCFDVSVWEIFGSTLSGAKLIVPSQETAKDTYTFGKLIEEQGVTILCQVPSPFYALMDVTTNQTFPNLRYLFLAGEALHPALLKEWHNNNEQCRIFNMYGPTETTVYTTYREIDDDVIERGISDIGKPLPTLKLYILNGNKLCGIGVPGELCIAGIGVARGYLNRQELTLEKFVDNPFEENVMYRTGDLVRWLPDGNVEYIGRMDDQAKIRGYRIEPREIESRLLELEGISAAVVLVREDKRKEKYLCGYVITEEEIEEKDIKLQLKERLPEYMVPTYIIRIDEIPLTRNGKLDRTMLPVPEYKPKKYVAPRSEKEILVAKAFEETLDVKNISVTDNFFELGGSSLKAVLLCNELEKTTGVRLSLKDLFIMATVEQIAKKIEETTTLSYVAIPKVEEAEYYETSSAQKRLYLMDKMMGPNISYNVSDVIEYEEPLEPQRLQKALDALLEREEILRTSFWMVDDEPVQVISKDTKVKLEFNKVDTVDIQKKYDDFVQPFDLSKAPLIRVKLLEAKGISYLFVDIHHIICDGESLPVLLQQVNELYEG